MKTALVVIVLVLLVCAFLVGSRTEEPVLVSESGKSGGAFEVRVVFPRLHRPFFGILPEALVAPLDGIPPELSFDHTSPGAEVGSVEPDRLELRADGWNLSIETDGEGRVAPATHLEFALALSSTVWRLRCRPASSRPGALWRGLPGTASADRDTGFLRTTTQGGGDQLSGHFLFELATCENAESGKAVDWPSAPITVRGSFEALPHGAG